MNNLNLTILLFIFSISSSFGKNQSFNDYIYKRDKFTWKGSSLQDHYYYDFNGDKRIDAMDVIVENGIDYFLTRTNGGYLKKISLRKEGKNFIERTYNKKSSDWNLISTNKISLINVIDNEDLRSPATNSQCEEIDPKIFYRVYEKSISCFLDSNKGGGNKEIIQKITSALRGNTFAKISDLSTETVNGVEFKKLKCMPKGQVFNCLETKNKDDTIADKEKALFHELLHLSGFNHIISKIDIVYACTECCFGENNLACKFCSDINLFKNLDKNLEYNLNSLIMYQGFIQNSNSSNPYHQAIEKVHQSLHHSNFNQLAKNTFMLSKDKIIETLFEHLVAHKGKELDKRDKNELFYSDMIAEIMAKIACIDFKSNKPINPKAQNQCEVLYLARSIPESYCFERSNKIDCKRNFKMSYLQRKKQFLKGLRIPANFKKLK